MQNINMTEVSVLYISTTVIVMHIKLKLAFFCYFDYSIIASVNVIHYRCSGFDNNGIFVSGKTFRKQLAPTLTQKTKQTNKQTHKNTKKRGNTKHIKPQWLITLINGRMRSSVPPLKRNSAVLPQNGGLDLMCMCNILHIDQEQHRDTLQASHMISGLIVHLVFFVDFYR